MSTGFGLFRNSNLLTAHEHVVNSYIDAYKYIHFLSFVVPLLETVTRNLNLVLNEKPKSELSGSYRVTKHRRKPSHSLTKRKSGVANGKIRDSPRSRDPS